MRETSAPARALLAFALLIALAGCPGTRPSSTHEFDKDDIFTPDPDGPDSMSRTFECLKRDADGKCLANKCTEGPGGATYDCGSFAKACVDADLHWSGTKQGGTCSVVL